MSRSDGSDRSSASTMRRSAGTCRRVRSGRSTRSVLSEEMKAEPAADDEEEPPDEEAASVSTNDSSSTVKSSNDHQSLKYTRTP